MLFKKIKYVFSYPVTKVTSKLCYKPHLNFLNKRLNPINKFAGQVFYRGNKRYIETLIYHFYFNWKRSSLSKLKDLLQVENLESTNLKSIQTNLFLLKFITQPIFHDLSYALYWQLTNYNILFRPTKSYIGKSVISTVKYVKYERRMQMLFKWLSLLIKINKRKTNFYNEAISIVLKNFLLQTPKTHQISQFKHKLYIKHLLRVV